jgi:hypothetical protein
MKDINEIEVPLINDTYQIREVNVSDLRFWTKIIILMCDKIMPIYFCVGCQCASNNCES